MKIRILFFVFLIIMSLLKVSTTVGQQLKSYFPSFDSKTIDSLAQVEQGSPVIWSIDSWLVESRLKALEKQIPLNYNFHTHQFVEYFAFKKADFTQRMLEKRDVYFPIYERY